MTPKQTAVEWLVEEMINQMGIRIENTTIGVELFEQAKEMFESQIEDAYDDGIRAGYGDYIDAQWGRDTNELSAKQYYKKKF